MKSIAIIPARGGSKRIPRKNIKIFSGKPIIYYAIQSALNSKCFDEVMVSTDDLEIAEISRQCGAQVPFLRSKETSTDHAMTADVLLEVLNKYDEAHQKFDLACCIYATSVFTTFEKLKKTKEILLNKEEVQATFPILRFGFPIQRAYKINKGYIEMMWPENYNVRSQDLEPTYHDAGQFYWFRVNDFKKYQRVLMDQCVGYEVPETEAQDIDSEVDWALAEIKFQRMIQNIHC